MIDVLTLNYNDADTTMSFVKSIEDYSIVRYIIIVDNKSTDDSYARLSLLANKKVIVIQCYDNLGYGGGNNLGIKYAKESLNSDYLLLSNPDVIIDEDVISTLEEFLRKNNSFAIAAPLMLDRNGKVLYNTGIKIPSLNKYILSFDCFYTKLFKPLFYSLRDLPKSVNIVGSVAGSCFLMDVNKMVEKGMYDEGIFLYGEELVLGLKMRDAGYHIGLLSKITFIHNHSVSINKTYNSDVKRQKLLTRSKLFIIKKYYKANKFEYAVALVMSKISILETYIISILK